MSKFFKSMFLLLTAGVFTATGWAQETVNPKPVYLLDAGKTATDGWTTINVNGDYNAFSRDDTAYEGLSAETTVGGNFFNKYSAPSFGFSEGRYEGLDGRIHKSVLTEMAATLGLSSIPESVYSDNLTNGGASNHILTVHGLNPEKCYVMYYIGGANKDSQAVAGFTLGASGSEGPGYLGNPVLDYVCTSGNASYATSTVTAYANVLPVTTALRAASDGYLLVRVSYVKPTAEGCLKFKLSGERANICALAIAEIDPQEDVSATVAGSVNFSDVEWSPSNAKPNANVILDVSGEATLTMNKTFLVNALTVQGAGPLTIAKTDSNKLTATTTTINADTTVNAGAANLGTVTINAEKTLTVKENWANVAKNVPTTTTNLGKIRFEGGSAETPIVFSMGSTNNANPGALVMAPGSVVKLTATGGNKVYNITGETGGDKANVLLYSGQNWGMTDGSVVRNVKLIVPSTDNYDFWLSPGITDATVNLELQGRKLTGDTGDGAIVLGDFVTNAEVVANGKSLSVQTGRISGTAGFNSAIAVDNSGEGTFTVARTYGAALTINGNGCVTVAEGGSLTGSVIVTGKLTYAADATPTNTITNNGTIAADGAGTEVNLTGATLSGSGTYAVKNGAMLILKKAQAAAGVTVAANATLKVKVDSYEAVTLDGVELDGENNVVFVLPSGEEVIGTGATMPKQSVYTYTATAGAENNWSTVANWKLNGVAVDAAPSGTVTTPVVVVLTEATTLTMDVADVKLSALSVSGGDLTIAGENALTVKTVATANKVVVSGKLILEAGTKAAPTKMANVFEVATGGTLTTKGYLNLTAENQVKSGGTLEVASGVTTLAAGDRTIKGKITINAETKLVAASTDALDYNNESVINIYGTLNMSDKRWTVFDGNVFNLYAGGCIIGDGESGRTALEVCENNTVNILANGDETTVTISTPMRSRDGGDVITFDVAKGLTCTYDGRFDGSGKIKAAGKGVLELTTQNTYNGGTEIVEGATLTITNEAALGTTGNITGAGTLVCDGVRPANMTGLTTGTAASDETPASGWTGTVWLKNVTTNASIKEFANANSSLTFEGSKGHFTSFDVKTLTLMGENFGFQPNNGYSAAGTAHSVMTIGALKESGSLLGPTQAGDQGAYCYAYVIVDMSEFTGTLDTTSYGDRTVVWCGAAEQSVNYHDYDGKIIIADAVTIANGKIWKAVNGVEVLSAGTLSGTGEIDSALTLADGATLNVENGAVTVTGAVTLPSELKVKIAESQDVAGSVTLLNAANVTNLGGQTVTVMVGETAGEKLYTVTHEGGAVKLTVAEHPVVTAPVLAGGTLTLSEALNGAELEANTILTIDFGNKGDSEAQPGTFTFNNTGAVSFAKIIVKGTNGGKIAKTGETVTTASLTVNTSATLANSAVAATDKVTIAENCVLTYEVGNNMTVNATHTGSGSIAVTSAGVVDGGKLEITKTCEVNVEVNSSASLVVNVDPAFDGDTFTKALADNVTVSGNGSVFLQQGIAYANFTVSYVEVGGTYYLGIGGTAEAPVGSFTPTSLTVGEGAALKVRAYRTYSLEVNDCYVNVKGSIARDGGTVEPTVKIANGKTLSGSGTINVPVTFETGGLLDVSQGALGVSSVTGTVTLAGYEGTAVKPVLYKTQDDVTFASVAEYTVVWKSGYYWLVKNTAKTLSAVAPVSESATAWSALSWQSSDGLSVSSNVFMLGLELTVDISAEADDAYVALNMPSVYCSTIDLRLRGDNLVIFYEGTEEAVSAFKSLSVAGRAAMEIGALNHVTGDVTISGTLYPLDVAETVTVLTKPLKGTGTVSVLANSGVTIGSPLGEVADGVATFAGRLYIGANGALTLAQSEAQTLTGNVVCADASGVLTLGAGAQVTLSGHVLTGETENTFGSRIALGETAVLTLTPSAATVLSGALEGAGELRVGDGSAAKDVSLTRLNDGYSGTITVAAGSTLSNGDSSATVPFGKGSIVNNGLLKLTGSAAEGSKEYAQLPPVSGTGDITFCSSSATRIAGAITTTGTVTIEGAQKKAVDEKTFVTLPAAVVVFGRDSRDFENPSASIEGPSIAIGAGATLARSDEASSVTIANGTTLSGTGDTAGTGTIEVPITFAEGSVLDATSDVKLNLTGKVTGTIYVKLDTAEAVLTTTSDAEFDRNTQLAFASDATSLEFARGGYRFAETVFKTTHTFTVVPPLALPGSLPEAVSGNAAAQDAIYDAVAALGSNITSVTAVTAQSTSGVTGNVEALALFENLYALATPGDKLTENTYAGTVTVYYDFGISQLHVKSASLVNAEDPQLYVLLCAKVATTQGTSTANYATGTIVTLYKGDTAVNTALTPTDEQLKGLGIDVSKGEKWFAVPMEGLGVGTHDFTVKARK